MSYRSELIQVAAVAMAAVQDLDKGTTGGKADYIREEVQEERENQEEKWGPQHHDVAKWFLILGEEVGEVANAILEKNIE